MLLLDLKMKPMVPSIVQCKVTTLDVQYIFNYILSILACLNLVVDDAEYIVEDLSRNDVSKLIHRFHGQGWQIRNECEHRNILIYYPITS